MKHIQFTKNTCRIEFNQNSQKLKCDDDDDEYRFYLMCLSG